MIPSRHALCRLVLGAFMFFLIADVIRDPPQALARPGRKTDLQTSLKALRRVAGVNYGPFRAGQRPMGPCPGFEEIMQDMLILKQMATAIRTYGLVDCALGEKILSAAAQSKMPLALGLWLSGNHQSDDREIDELKRIAAVGIPHVLAVVVGSEVLLRGDMPMENLIGYLTRVKAIVPNIPVATAEPWDIWLGLDARYPNPGPLIKAVDFLFLNIHLNLGVPPARISMCPDEAADAVLTSQRQIREAVPQKPVVISETGWPTDGDLIGCASPSLQHQHWFLVRFLCQAHSERVGFFYFEAFDEPWKAPPEIEAHWGLYTVARSPKQPITIVRRCPLLSRERGAR